MLLCTYEPLEIPLQYTHRLTHRVHRPPAEPKKTLGTVIHTLSELNQRFHLEGKHQAPLLPPITMAWKRSQRLQLYTITSSGRKSAPFRSCFEPCTTGISHLNYHILKGSKNGSMLLAENGSIQFGTEAPCTLFFSM